MKGLNKYIAECIGTMVLVVLGCGVAVGVGCGTAAGIVATSLAFGLSIVAMAFSIGNISGCHINPAVSLAMLINKKITAKEFALYVLSQVVGAIVGALLVALFFGSFESLGANQVQYYITAAYEQTAVQYIVALVAEVFLTFVFVISILGVTSKVENKAVTGIVIGLSLTLVHLLGIVLTGTSVNPARSFGPALLQAFSGNTEALKQVWIFIVGPFAGAALAAVCYKALSKEE